MGEQVEKRIWEGIFKWSGSAAGIAVILTVVVAALATLDRGPYVLVNTVVIGGMLALVAMGLALVFGVMKIPMFAHYYGILTPDVMHTSKTVEVLAVAYIGGRGSLWGGAAVAFPFIFAMELVRSFLSNLPGLNLLLYGLLLIVVMIYYPGGFAGFFNSVFRKTKNKTIGYFLNATPSAACQSRYPIGS